MKTYLITARTARGCFPFFAIAMSSGQAAEDAADLFNDEPCGITVTCLE